MSSVAVASAGWPSKARSAFRRWLREFTLPSAIGLAVLIALVLVVVAAPLVTSQSPTFQDYTAILKPPSAEHILGTDHIGRDVFARVLYGGQVSLIAGVGAVAIAVIAGVLIGVLAGVGGRAVDEVLMRIMDAVQSFPGLVLALTLTAVLGPSLINTSIAIGVVSIPSFARLARAQVLVIRELDYIQASRIGGARLPKIVLRHVLPNISGPLVVQATFLLAAAILGEAALSFLGLGILPPAPSWGSMLRDAYPYLASAPWLAFAPGVAVFIAVLSLNFAGDGLRKVLDPSSKQIAV
jgi:peptide/nickel transport system permease protein